MTTISTPLPTLESGDRLTRDEFHRRYCARPDIKKAELIGGVVYLASPVRLALHGEPHIALAAWLYTYTTRHDGVRAADNATVLLDHDGEVQPDLMLFRPAGGRVRVTDEDYVEGAPELVIEIAASSASHDLHDKYKAYEAAGVREYIVWRTEDAAVDWFYLVGDKTYQRTPAGADGMMASREFAGLRLDMPKLLAGDHAGVLAALGDKTARGEGAG